MQIFEKTVFSVAAGLRLFYGPCGHLHSYAANRRQPGALQIRLFRQRGTGDTDKAEKLGLLFRQCGWRLRYRDPQRGHQLSEEKRADRRCICGTKTLAALGISSGSSSSSGYGGYTANEFNLLARIISAEARGEPYEGQVAVGAVILNRVAHPSFPNTLAGVIYQPGAFSCLNDGGVNAAVADSAYNAARDAINGWDPSGGAIYYYNPVKSTNQWIFSRPVIVTIGEHRFCS